MLAKKRTHAWEPVPPDGLRRHLSAKTPSCNQLYPTHRCCWQILGPRIASPGQQLVPDGPRYALLLDSTLSLQRRTGCRFSNKTVHIPEIGLLIKVARPIRWIKRKRGWYRGQTALSRVNAVFIIYQVCYSHSHTTDGRGDCRDRSRPEQPQLNPISMDESEFCWRSARRYSTDKASRQQGTMNGST